MFKLKRLFRRRPTKGTLFYLGANNGNGLDQIYEDYERIFAFEANPYLAERLTQKYKHNKRINIVNCALAEHKGECSFNIYSNDGACSSIGKLREDSKASRSGVALVRRITVKSINLFEFCEENSIRHIDLYVSDIQGFDLLVLKTMRPLLQIGAINEINAEVHKNAAQRNYDDVPDNSQDGFIGFFQDLPYRLAATGSGLLQNEVFEEVPADWVEMDMKWVYHLPMDTCRSN